jgi:hypothetical protein
MGNEHRIEKVRKKFERWSEVLDERSHRVWASVEAEALGYGGQSLVANATGLCRTTGHGAGLEKGEALAIRGRGRIRHSGGGRQPLVKHEPPLLLALEGRGEPTTRGDPEGALGGTGRSSRHWAAARQGEGYRIRHRTVASLVEHLGYSLHGNRTTQEGAGHGDRDAPFKSLPGRVEDGQRRGQPGVSVDTKKNELVGEFKNGGPTWRSRGDPQSGRV